MQSEVLVSQVIFDVEMLFLLTGGAQQYITIPVPVGGAQVGDATQSYSKTCAERSL